MNWLLIAVSAYFITALAVIIDKFLLSSKRVAHPAEYAFFSGIVSLIALAFAPWGFHWVSFSVAFFSVLAGAVFLYGILALFFAIQKNEASQVMPVVGAATPLVTFALAWLFLGERLSGQEMIGMLLLIAGGLLISFNLPFRFDRIRFFAGFRFSLLSGFLLAVAFTAFKYLYDRDNLFNVYIWTRFGLALGALSLLGVGAWRNAIRSSFGHVEEKKTRSTGFLFILNKAIGGVGQILTHKAIQLGSVAIINALVALEYAFVFLFGLVFSLWFPRIFTEKHRWFHVLQKIASIIIISLGIALVSRFKP